MPQTIIVSPEALTVLIHGLKYSHDRYRDQLEAEEKQLEAKQNSDPQAIDINSINRKYHRVHLNACIEAREVLSILESDLALNIVIDKQRSQL